MCDIRDENQIIAAIEKCVSVFGGIDILVNNASALHLAGITEIESKKFDLINSINVRGTFLVTKHAIPYLEKSSNPHILNLSPPLDWNPKWFKDHVAYTMTKFSMSMMVVGLSEELRPKKIAVNALWPRTIIGTAALGVLSSGKMC